MLAPEVRFEGWDVLDWVRLLSLFEGSPTPSAGLFVLHDGSSIRKLLHARVGRLDPGDQRWGGPLDALAQQHGADWVVTFHLGALEELMDRFGAKLRREDDLLDQAWKGLEVIREMAAEGAIGAWPLRLQGVPMPSLAVVRRGIDALCPPGKVLTVGLFERGELWTTLTISRNERGIDRILGPEQIRGSVGLLSGDFRRDYWHLLRVIEQQVGSVHVGLFTEVKTLRRLIAEGRPGSWARATLVRDLILTPMPPTMALPLGLDAARGLSRSLGVALGRLQMDRRFAEALATVRSPEQRGTLWEALRQLVRKLSGGPPAP